MARQAVINPNNFPIGQKGSSKAKQGRLIQTGSGNADKVQQGQNQSVKTKQGLPEAIYALWAQTVSGNPRHCVIKHTEPSKHQKMSLKPEKNSVNQIYSI